MSTPVLVWDTAPRPYTQAEDPQPRPIVATNSTKTSKP